ncbi:CCR4-NOT transcription complex subunit 6-like [Homarus americanus]|uniref:CCR4-NOT transcription complex subunit 6-like n=1 Tax=Homarus americanus TaxID=6706 RepID=A0A8J5MV11_HOMAM|nr:CCR4-NOT transcription complex subunit 6-like [Homarus americanus]
MEIVNEVLSVTEEAVFAKLKRDDVLQVLAVRFSFKQLHAAAHLLEEWIGWRAGREDVARSLLFEDEPSPSTWCCCGATTHHHVPGADTLEEWKGGREAGGLQLCRDEGVDSPVHTSTCPHHSETGKTIVVKKFSHTPPANSKMPVRIEGRGAAGGHKMCDADLEDLSVEDSWPGGDPLTGGGNPWLGVSRRGEGVSRRGSVSHNDDYTTPSKDVTQDKDVIRRVKGGGTPWLAVSRGGGVSCDSDCTTLISAHSTCCSVGCQVQAVCTDSSTLASTDGTVDVDQVTQPKITMTGETEACKECHYTTPVPRCVCPDGWVVLESKGTNVPFVTLKIWKLVNTFWDILPNFVRQKPVLRSPGRITYNLHREMTEVNRLLEQLHTRLRWVLPLVCEEGGVARDHDLSVEEDFTLQEDLHVMKSWLCKIYKCTGEGSHHLDTEGRPDSPSVFPKSSTASIPTSEECDSEAFSESSSRAEEVYEIRLSSDSASDLEDCPDIIEDDLLSWLWQAIRSGMNEQLVVHLLASHYSLREVHHSRNILTSYNFSLSYMKGVRGLLFEMLCGLRSATDDNNNAPNKKVPKFVSRDVNNRPSVRPVKHTDITSDLEVLADIAHGMTTDICWLLPEARRYSSSMEEAGIGTLAPQLKATSHALTNLKTILDWELGTVQHTTGTARRVVGSRHTYTCHPESYDTKDGTLLEHSKHGGHVQCWSAGEEEKMGGALGVPSDHQVVPSPPHHRNSHAPLHQVCALSSSHLQEIRETWVKPALEITLTTPQPPQRPWIHLGEPERTKPSCIFTVMCYNVLCDKYATRQMYGYCPSWALEWEYRKKGIMDEIKHYLADIITLQEVETDQFFNFFLPELKNEGYDGIFSPKSRAKHMSENERKYVDGCAIFWRTSKFTLVKERLIEFNQLAMANHDGSEDMLNRVMTKDNIGLAALLETKEAAWENSGVVEFLTKGSVSMDHEDFKSFGYKTCLQKIAVTKNNNSLVNTSANLYTHSFRLSAAYDFSIMAYTNYTYDFKGIIDYIFHSADTMSSLGVLGPIDPDWFRENKVMGCPHPHIPSGSLWQAISPQPTPPASTVHSSLVSVRRLMYQMHVKSVPEVDHMDACGSPGIFVL